MSLLPSKRLLREGQIAAELRIAECVAYGKSIYKGGSVTVDDAWNLDGIDRWRLVSRAPVTE